MSLRQKHFGIWQSVTWGEFGQYAREIGMGLVALGFEPGECASVLSNTNREWLYADMGILGAGGVSNGIYPTDAPAQVEYLCSDSSTVYLFVEDDEQLDKALEVRAQAAEAAQDLRVRHGRPARFQRPPGDEPRRAARDRARIRRRASGRVGAARRACAGPATWRC